MTSNRPGTGSDDIYKFAFGKILKPIKSRELYVYDINRRYPISGARITMFDENAYQTNAEGKIDSLTCNEVECKVLANAFGYYEKTQVLTPCNLNVSVTRDTVWMQIIENKKIVLRNIYYELFPAFYAVNRLNRLKVIILMECLTNQYINEYIMICELEFIFKTRIRITAA